MPVLILIRKKEKNKRFFNNPMRRALCLLEYLLTTIKAYKFRKFIDTNISFFIIYIL